MAMPGRTSNSPEYRYGFNGKEKDESGEFGNLTHYDYGFRIYNPGIGRFLSVDPIGNSFPYYTPYQFAGNKPIVAIDIDGLEDYIIHSETESDAFMASEIDLFDAGEVMAYLEKRRDIGSLKKGPKYPDVAKEKFGYEGGNVISRVDNPDAFTVQGYSTYGGRVHLWKMSFAKKSDDNPLSASELNPPNSEIIKKEEDYSYLPAFATFYQSVGEEVAAQTGKKTAEFVFDKAGYVIAIYNADKIQADFEAGKIDATTRDLLHVQNTTGAFLPPMLAYPYTLGTELGKQNAEEVETFVLKAAKILVPLMGLDKAASKSDSETGGSLDEKPENDDKNN